MNKKEFIESLREKLIGLPNKEIDERVNFYSEIIDDKIEEGLTEEQAVIEIGDVNEIAKQIIGETPFIKIVKEKIMPRRQLSWWEITLIAIGSPIWFAILVSIVAVVFSLYVSGIAVLISFWGSIVAIAGGSLGGLLYGIVLLFKADILLGVLIISCSIVLAGLFILLIIWMTKLTKLYFVLTKKVIISIKNAMIRKERE